ncbi:MAG: elongation factor P [Balneolales bacterium]
MIAETAIFSKLFIPNIIMAKVSTASFKNGLTIEQSGELYTIIDFQHVKPGKGGAFVRTKLKGVVTGKVLDKTFRAGESVEAIRVERHNYQYLYHDGELYHFMHQETYEQVMVTANQVNNPELLKESEIVTLTINAETEEILFTELPAQVTLLVQQTDPGLKGDTAQGGTKPATLESGAIIQVPLFINQGDLVRVDTRTSAYIERVKQ